MNKILYENQKGVVAILTLLAVSVFALLIMTTMSVLAADELKMSGSESTSEKTFYAAEAGINEALYKMANSAPDSDPYYSTTINGVAVTVNKIPDPANPLRYIITSTADDPSGIKRELQLTAGNFSFSGGFDYAVQGGNSGVFLKNNSKIYGKDQCIIIPTRIYSNSSIVGYGSENGRSEINGKVEVAWILGDTQEILDNVIIKNGNAYAHTINDTVTVINGQKHYIDLPTLTLPISDQDVQEWKDEITQAIDPINNPVLTPTNNKCPNENDSNPCYVINSNPTFNFPKKINADLYISNGNILTLKGNLWVTGNIYLKNNGTLRLDTNLGSASAVIVADGKIIVENNYTICGACDLVTKDVCGQPDKCGTCDSRSFLLLLSTKQSLDENDPAIEATNNSSSIIFATTHGTLKVKQNGQLVAIAAEQLYLDQRSNVIYNPNLAAFTIPGTGTPSVGIMSGSWQEK